MSKYIFKGPDGSLTLDYKVSDKQGLVKTHKTLKQVDRVERKYSVTTNKYSKYVLIKI